MEVTIDYLKEHPQHQEIVAEWVFSEWGKSFGASTIEATRQRVAGRMRDNAIPLAMIALDDGEPVGTISLKIDDMDTRPELTPWIASVYVRKDMRGRGIGSMLVSGAEEAARKIGIQKLYLFTENRRSFYERLGWVFFEETDYCGEKVTILSKEVS